MLHWLKPSSIKYPQKGRSATLVYRLNGHGCHNELNSVSSDADQEQALPGHSFLGCLHCCTPPPHELEKPLTSSL